MKSYKSIIEHLSALIIPAAACVAMPGLLAMFGHTFTQFDWYVTGIIGWIFTIRLLSIISVGALTKKLAIIQACIAVTLGLDWATGGTVNAVAMGYFWLSAEVLAFVSFFDGPKRLYRMLTNRVSSYAGGY